MACTYVAVRTAIVAQMSRGKVKSYISVYNETILMSTELATTSRGLTKCGDGMHFPRNIVREYGRANESYSHYAIYRIAICVQMVSQVREHLQRATEGILSDTERVVVMWYIQDLSELVNHELVGYWETYLDNIEQQNESTAYRVPVVRFSGRGQPSFDINWNTYYGNNSRLLSHALTIEFRVPRKNASHPHNPCSSDLMM